MDLGCWRDAVYRRAGCVRRNAAVKNLAYQTALGGLKVLLGGHYTPDARPECLGYGLISVNLFVSLTEGLDRPGGPD
jgi:hypothetical protein